MKVGLTFDLKGDWQPGPKDPVDANAEFDKDITVNNIAAALTKGGHQTRKIGNVHKLLAEIDHLDVDIIFNICEGRGSRNRESQVPVLLDIKGIPFVGSDGLTLGVTLDKIVAKKCFIADGIPTPKYFAAMSRADIPPESSLKFPMFVKASCEGTSKSLTEKSRVTDYASLCEQVEHVARTYRQPALVEEFIRGTEFTVAVLGNDGIDGGPKAMPVCQVSIDGNVQLGDLFYDYERIFSPNLRYVCPAKISDDLKKKLQDYSVRAYRSVGCRDFGRVDFRVDDSGQPYVLEINPYPSLGPDDVFNIFPQSMGSTYEETVNKILHFALERTGLLRKNEKAAGTCSGRCA